MGDSPLTYLLAGIVIGSGVALAYFWRQQRKSAKSATSLREAVGSLLRDSGAEPPVASLTGSDRAVYRALADQVALLRSWLVRIEMERDLVLSRVGDGVFVLDADRVVVRVNRAQADRMRLPEQRIVGRSLIEVLRDHEVDAVAKRCLESRHEEHALVETGTGRRFVQVIAAPLEAGGGCVVVLQDRTELRRLERVRREFVANISHELRTPLASLRLLSETLSMGGSDDPEILKDYLGRIEVEVDRLAQMVDELGELSLIETGQITLEKSPVPIALLVHRAAERLGAQAARAGLTMAVDVPDGLPHPCGDARRLEQVLVNLIHNAIKFTPEGGGIRVTAGEVDGMVRVSVQDSGMGIASDDLERIFERFYKADKSRSSTGTGLGLAIARHIIDLHGGTIRADSVQGRGSTVSFTLPLGAVQECR